ncbi:MAG: hypothetical protein QHH15_08195, partial [Candidatus Thermoplasmatota archaeon]|nr:hypothetical protein [Candidatus Thermoplasmatota archaeon]
MKSKIKFSVLIIIALLVSTSSILFTSASAAELRDIRGYVYVDGVITTPASVSLVFDKQQKTAFIPGSPVGYYAISIQVANGKTGVFYVTLSGRTWQAEEKITITFGVIVYKNFNLTINTSLPPINNAPNTPTNPSPKNGATNIATNKDLSWSCSDPDG